MRDADGKDGRRVVTPSQTVGPFFAYCLTPRDYRRDDLVTNDLVAASEDGPRITVEGVVLDGRNQPIVDAMLELWQADARGRYLLGADGGGFRGFGRAETDLQGRYGVTTIKPGAVVQPDGRAHAPHINVSIFAKGLQRQLFTRIYFEDEPANAHDPVLGRVPPRFVETLIAKRVDAEPRRYRFDIRLRGAHETVFFEV